MKPEAGKRQAKLSEAGTHGDQKTSPVITVNALRTAEPLSAARGARITSISHTSEPKRRTIPLKQHLLLS